MASSAGEPVLLEGLCRRGGTVGVAPTADQLQLHFEAKQVQLLDSQSGVLLFSRQLGRRGSVPAALAWLLEAQACELSVLDVQLEEACEAGEETLAVLLGVELLQPFFEAEAETEAAVHVGALVQHWSQLAAQADGDGEAPFAAKLRQGWWPQPSGEEQRATDGTSTEQAAEQAGEAQGSSNLRDQVFGWALPSDWRLEAAEPCGLRCTLFRYQRRCLAWLRWRESLLRQGSREGSTHEREQTLVGGATAGASAAMVASSAEGCLPDTSSVKSVLPGSNLLWQPLRLPSGQAAYYSPLDGTVRREAVAPALPEVPGGLVCDEMGLGKTVEMIALFLANPPAASWRRSSPPQQQLAAGSEAAPGDSDAEDQPAPAEAPAASPAANGGSPGEAGEARQQPLRGGTLVVCPPALLQQWQSELGNHAHGALTVEVYDGLRGLQAAVAAEGGGGRRKKPAQREMELYSRLLAGDSLEPSYDSEVEAQALLRRILAADVVLTSFDVLRAEVHFVPNARTLRQPKRYKVPTCPLLEVHWWRLVVDEAQMVGPLSAAGTMCERMKAVHRWCVTGTPMGALRSGELADIHALLTIIKHQPFSDAAAWRHLVAGPLALDGPPAAQARRLLESTVRGLMWRNTKAVVATEYHLPPRRLHPVWLTFKPGERAFYEQVVEQTRKSREELLSFRSQGQEGGAGEAGSPAAKRRRHTKQSERLELAAADNLTQLRLACIHPQLTKSWRELAAEGQISLGTALSMEEIMARLVDNAQFDLQEAERELCAHLNTLAMRLMAKAEEGPSTSGKHSSKDGGVPSSQPRDEEADGGDWAEEARPAKRPRKSKGGGSESVEELRARALLLLQQSFRVAEKGIAAIDISMEQLKSLPDITAASGSTVNAWKRLQISTASQLRRLYALAGADEEAQRMDVDAQEKVAYLRSQAEMELQMAQQRLTQCQAQADAAREAFRLHLQAAAERGFGRWGVTGSAGAWLGQLEGTYLEAQQQERRELEQQEGTVRALLGTRVAAALDEFEKQLHGELTVLDRYVTEQHTAAAHRRLLREEQGWAAASAAAPAGGGQAGVLDRGVEALWGLMHVLPDFRRKTLVAQHQVLFSRQLVEEGERRRRAAEERRKEQAAAKQAAAAAAGVTEAGGSADVEVVGGEAVGQGGEPVTQQQQEMQQQQHQNPQQRQQQHQQQPSQQQQERPQAGAQGPPPAQQQPTQDDGALAGVLQAAEAGAAFVASSSWRGRVPGFVFKLGDSGVGYYRDSPPPQEAFLTVERLHLVAAAVGRALQDAQRRLARSAGPEADFFASLSLDAVEAKLESVKQQIRLVRALKEQHTAERSVALKQALQEELDAELADAARLPPLPGGGSVDKLQKEVERLKEQATSLLHKMRYMESRVSEARAQGQPQQQQQQQQAEKQGIQPQPQPQQANQDQQQQPMQQQQPQPQDALPEPQPPAHTSQQVGVQQLGSDAGGAGSSSAPAAAGSEGAAGTAGEPAAGPDGAPQAGMECPVCLQHLPAQTDIHVFSGCGHAFCPDCAKKLVLETGFCAVCRQKVTAKQVFRVAAGGGGASSGGSAVDPEFEQLGKIQPLGEWSSKVEALLRRVLHIATTAPADKCLVFSQFPDALKLAARALQANGVKFVQLIGGRQGARRAVGDFREDDEVRVFLLSHKAGAQGLTLTRGSHVFLLEPALEPAIEQQAVARVHRIGQQRPVTVTRLLVRDTIEHTVLAVQESKHALFAGQDGSAEDTAELATTVEGPIKHEKLGREEMEGLLDAV